MTAIPTPAADAADSFGLFRDILAPDLDHPADYWNSVAWLLSLHLSHIGRAHRHCTEPGCRICIALADVVALAQAHNSLQTFDEVTETDQPYALLSYLTSDCTPQTTGATA